VEFALIASVLKAATSCHGAAGSFVTVAITSSYWASDILPQPFAATILQVSACFPVSAG
jgi:hypothetical protein